MPGATGPTVEADEVIHQYPVSTPAVHPAVPEAVTKSTVEAAKCLSVGAYNACGVMLRRAIHDLCAEKKAIGGDLYAQLKSLKENGSITPDIWEWAEELRILGRSGAHPEWQDVEPEEAEYGMRFLDEIIKYVYVNPHERQSMKLKESKSKK